MRLYIPKPGDIIELTKDWTFDLYNEHRNAGLIKFLGVKYPPKPLRYYEYQAEKVTLKTGYRLKIDRIYIKKPLPEFNSVTFWLSGEKVPLKDWEGRVRKRMPRFWAKLRDVNQIEFDPVEAS